MGIMATMAIMNKTVVHCDVTELLLCLLVFIFTKVFSGEGEAKIGTSSRRRLLTLIQT